MNMPEQVNCLAPFRILLGPLVDLQHVDTASTPPLQSVSSHSFYLSKDRVFSVSDLVLGPGVQT